HLADEIAFRPDGRIVRRAHQVLAEAEAILQRIADRGLFAALADGVFADTRRPRDRGRGYEGVVARDPAYANPFMEAWSQAPAGATA
ncbi:MAG TPA: lysine 5,6-aminomutase subunit alpha, partial [Thermoanaerobaculia bacterium]|nr:lysine 5,6-aminomutase subunit alpha [Thermoanaerobaculia bacterium]